MSRRIYTALGGELFVQLWLETRRRDEKRDSHVMNAEVIARNHARMIKYMTYVNG